MEKISLFAVTIGILCLATSAQATEATPYPAQPNSVSECQPAFQANIRQSQALNRRIRACISFDTMDSENSVPTPECDNMRNFSQKSTPHPKCAGLYRQQCRLKNFNDEEYDACRARAQRAEAARQAKARAAKRERQEAARRAASHRRAIEQRAAIQNAYRERLRSRRRAANEAQARAQAKAEAVAREFIASQLPESARKLWSMGEKGKGTYKNVSAMVDASSWVAGIEAVGGVGRDLNSAANTHPISSTSTDLAIDMLVRLHAAAAGDLDAAMAQIGAQAPAQRLAARWRRVGAAHQRDFTSKAAPIIPGYAGGAGSDEVRSFGLPTELHTALTELERWQASTARQRKASYTQQYQALVDQEKRIAAQRQRQAEEARAAAERRAAERREAERRQREREQVRQLARRCDDLKSRTMATASKVSLDSAEVALDHVQERRSRLRRMGCAPHHVRDLDRVAAQLRRSVRMEQEARDRELRQTIEGGIELLRQYQQLQGGSSGGTGGGYGGGCASDEAGCLNPLD
ncbi:hypothetical protein H0Z60_14615 [Ectothiorhodospiraceae bacterium WFHF3C12]|nr:hypothetical protein [Ectothiorhodospiraceae bacterium WFHF3C12]